MDRRGARRSSRRKVRPFFVVIAIAALLIGAWQAVRQYHQRHLRLHFTMAGVGANDREDARLGDLELSFYPQQLAFASPSPPAALGHVRITGGGTTASITVGADLLPGQGVVRYRSIGVDGGSGGIGAGFAFVELGTERTITLHPPAKYVGRVGRTERIWFRGWRTVAMRAVAGAEVMLMGGGEHGVDLAVARTNENGWFVIDGFDGELDALGLRVRAPGHAVLVRRLDDIAQGVDGKPLLVLEQVPPRRGRVQLALGANNPLRVEQLRVLARGLPGVEATPAADGSFVLDGVPGDLEARIVLHGLPDDCAFAEVRTDRKAPIEVKVVLGGRVSGRVVRPFDRQPVAGAIVWCGEQDAVRTNAAGCFELSHVLPGSVELRAQWQPKQSRDRRAVCLGALRLEVLPGSHAEDKQIELER